jgi:Fe2+ transport system protein FeoA
MGLTPNTTVMVRKVAPMGDPIELHLRSYELTIRQEDAKKIEVLEVAE